MENKLGTSKKEPTKPITQKSKRSGTSKGGWKDPGSTENVKTNSLESDGKSTLLKTEPKSGFGDVEETRRTALSPSSMLAPVETSLSPNLIDDTAKHLRELMKSIAPSKSEFIESDFEVKMNTNRVKAAVGCAKEIQSLLRLKLDVIKAAVSIEKTKENQ